VIQKQDTGYMDMVSSTTSVIQSVDSNINTWSIIMSNWWTIIWLANFHRHCISL